MASLEKKDKEEEGKGHSDSDDEIEQLQYKVMPDLIVSESTIQ